MLITRTSLEYQSLCPLENMWKNRIIRVDKIVLFNSVKYPHDINLHITSYYQLFNTQS